MFGELPFNFNLTPRNISAEKTKKVLVFKNLISHIGIGRRKCDWKIIDAFAAPFNQSAFYLQCQYITTSPVFKRFLCIPYTFVLI